MTLSSSWQEEQLFFSGDEFFKRLCSALQVARESIDIEVYIFETNDFGERIVNLLENAAQRGVAVRVMVDGVGSANWAFHYAERLERKGILTSVYHELPWRRLVRRPLAENPRRSLLRLLGSINKRNHRKSFIMDNCLAFVGSLNISQMHLSEFAGKEAWRDTGLCISGPALLPLARAYDLAFSESTDLKHKWRERRRLKLKAHDSELVKLNITRRQRRANYRDLLLRIRSAQNSVQIETAYFVPKPSLVRAMKKASRRGALVELIVPRRSDVFFMEYVARAFYQQLIKGGVIVYEYLPRFLHAKTVRIDNWAIVGSTNLNHRSLLHDLEVDIVLSSEAARRELVWQFEIDRKHSVRVEDDEWFKMPLWKRLIASILLACRQWL